MLIDYRKVNFTTTEINRNFKIKVYGTNNGTKVDKAVGVSGLIREIGDYEIVNSMIEKAFNKGADKVICKLRRGLKVTFYSY